MPVWFFVLLGAFAAVCTGVYAVIMRGRVNRAVSGLIAVAALVVGYFWSYSNIDYFVPPTTALLHFRLNGSPVNVETVAERWLYGTTLPTVPGTLSSSRLVSGLYLVDWNVKGHDMQFTLSRHYHILQGANIAGDALMLILESGQYN